MSKDKWLRARGAAGTVEDDRHIALEAHRALTSARPPHTMTSVEKSDSEMTALRDLIHPIFLEWYEILWRRDEAS